MLEESFALELKGVNLYSDGRIVFEQVDLAIHTGEIFVIFGPAGTHKSDFLKLCIGLIPPQEGKILLKGQPINDLSQEKLQKLRQKIGFVFERSALLNNLTLFDNIALPLRYHTDLDEKTIHEKVEEKINLLEINGYEKMFPAQLPPSIEKRTSIARALIMEPEIIFYDEPTAELDTLGAETIANLIKRINEKGVTSLVATYNIPTVLRLAKRLALIKDKKISVIENLEDVQNELISHLPKF
jgi:phospholipid/cholesterol/gamma-HCH transport system ATP-binding protein